MDKMGNVIPHLLIPHLLIPHLLIPHLLILQEVDRHDVARLTEDGSDG